MAKRRVYTDKFRANAVVTLEAQGFPDVKGALTAVATHLDVPATTLSGWFYAYRNPPPAEVRDEKRGDLVALLQSEADAILGDMGGKRIDADYRSLGTVLGIVIDKLQLLQNKPTAINEDIEQVDFDLSALTIGQLEALAGLGAQGDETSPD